ncbi:MAG: hypothetical protein GY873_13675 [Bosea sp.]|uniref:hypothetical protein n=1 Tax=Bosea sp. (in: a-proteobacteria) TaxID=1871050 RepID=UPI00238D127E|nr:hypothetical protein [Bosea sp. (in: a-proteobacteria)]MCP4735229.1 hypothetical protein [Bosea sp. (in: a-proteobacteria)]
MRKVDATAHGNREDVYRDLAREMGVSVHVPRRLARAHRFLDYVDEAMGSDLAGSLRKQPLTSVSALARWSNYAPDRAMQAAQRLVAGEINLAGITALEEADRKTGERISAATDRAWQTFATKRAVEFVTSLDPQAELVWTARGWGLGGPRIEIKAPGALGQLDHLPVLHLIFARQAREDGRALVVSVLSTQAERPRMPTALAQIILILSAYARLGYDCMLLCGLTEDLEVANRVLDQLGRPGDVEARLIDLT